MRPPLNAGENDTPGERDGGERGASMRPPLNAGENGMQGRHWRDDIIASMRPPLNAGENCDLFAPAPPETPRFNEAPAERGGKRARSPGT